MWCILNWLAKYTANESPRRLLRYPGGVIKESPTTSTIKVAGNAIATVRKSDISKIRTQHEQQTHLKLYDDCRWLRTSQNLVEEKIQSHKRNFICKLELYKKVKHKRRDPGRRISFSKSNISHALRGRITKIPKFRLFSSQNEANINITKQIDHSSTHCSDFSTSARLLFHFQYNHR